MTQISRPFQIALLAMSLFAAVWFFVLQGHSNSTSGSGSSAAPSTPSQSASATASGSSAKGSPAGAEKTAAPTPVYHGAAPGVEGLTRAIAKAHEAVANSQLDAKQLEEKSAQASSASSSAGTGAQVTGSTPTTTATSVTVSKATTTTQPVTVHRVKVHVVTRPATTNKIAPSGAPAKSVPRMQATVEAELKQGKMVAILFWNPKSSVDEVVQHELQAVAGARGEKLAVHDARAVQVGSFGSITRDVQVFATPTILIVNRRGQTTSLTGLADTFSIEQAIAEARMP
jgi:hypothetical protein